MKQLGIKRAEEYEQLLNSSRAEWEELMEAVVITETWFFREEEAFATAIRLVREEWLPQHPSGRVRFLSLPCSSGEEPYSMAMAMLDAQISPDRFEIDAVDISACALARARRAVYRKNSFRGKNLEFRSRYFKATPDGYLLDPRVRGCVRFQQGNLLTENLLTSHRGYDFVFCRNLLIYFDSVTQTKAVARISSLLAPNGVLFVGPAEQPLVLERGFVSALVPMAFACRKLAPGAERPSRVERRLGSGSNLPRVPAVAPERPMLPVLEKRTANTRGGSLADLGTAKELADNGRLEEAAKMCEAHLKEVGPSAQAYYLLGLVRDAAGDPAAPEYYRKALYLEPDHYETLLQLALWLEKNGEKANARRLKTRAQRIKQYA